MKPVHILLAAWLGLWLSSAKANPDSFEWAMGDFAGQRGVRVAMLVTVLVDRRPCTMQLDTGMGAAVAWHEYGGTVEEPQRVSVKFANIQARPHASKAARALIAKCQAGQPIGSIGNGFFEAGTLSLDLKRRQVSYRKGSALRTSSDARPFEYRRVGDEGGQLRVDLIVGDDRLTALLDTGSTAVDVGVFSQQRWEQLTSPPDQASASVQAFEVHAWGKQHRCFMAIGAVPVRVGAAQIKSPHITYCPTIDAGASSGVAAVVGMMPFANSLVVIDYPAQRWSVRDSD